MESASAAQSSKKSDASHAEKPGPARFTHFRRILSLFLTGLFLAIPQLPLCAQLAELRSLLSQALEEPESQNKNQPPPEAQLDWTKQQIEQIEKKLSAIASTITSQSLEAAGLSPDLASQSKQNLTNALTNYRAAQDALRTVISSSHSPEQQPPIIEPPADEKTAENLRREADALRSSIASMLSDAEIQKTLLSSHQAREANLSRRINSKNEELSLSEDSQKPRATLELEILQSEHLAASSAAFAASWTSYAIELEIQENKTRLKAIEKALAASPFNSVFYAGRAQFSLASIEEQKTKLSQTIEKLRSQAAEAAALAQKHRTAQPNSSLAQISSETAKIHEKNLRSAQLWLAILNATAETWRSALEISQNPSSLSLLREIKKHSEKSLSEITSWQKLLSQNLRENASRLESLQNLTRSAESVASRKAAEARSDALKNREKILRELTSSLDEFANLQNELLKETSSKLSQKSPRERGIHLAQTIAEKILNIWNTELFSTEKPVFGADGRPFLRRRAVTLGMLFIAALFSSLALYAALRISRALSHQIQARLSIEPSRARGVQRFVFFILAAAIVLITLNYINIPLTAFAFLGGALAIGIGFGAQNLTNNFISGLILLAEQRIKIGDIIEVDGHTGRIKQLGTRCAYIERFDGVEILIPNSSLLEKNVTNATLSHNLRRYEIKIGLDYGTDPETVLEILNRLPTYTSDVLKSPPPKAFFEEFSESTLDFRLYYWINVRLCDPRVVGSQLRLALAKELHNAGITIAFPQRDVHLHTPSPLRVQIHDTVETKSPKN